MPEGFKIGAAVGEGDCFFDSVAQGLNELKDKGLITSSEEFNVKSLRKSCKQYAEEELKQQKNSSWLNKALQGELEGSIEGYTPRIEFTAEDIENASSDSTIKILKLENAIWGRTEVEGKIISKRYNVRIKVIELHENPIDGLHVTTGEEGTGDNVIYIVNYRNHFVPLLSNIEKDILVSRKGVYNEEISTSSKQAKAKKGDKSKVREKKEIQGKVTQVDMLVKNEASGKSSNESVSLGSEGAQKKKERKEKNKDKGAKKRKGEEEVEANLSKILTCCEKLMFNTIERGGNLFELLDPLVSDTQCHIHSLLILDILSKFYDVGSQTGNSERFQNLTKEDRKAFLCAVLLSLFKFEWKDKLGLTTHEVSLETFPAKQREELIAKVSQEIFPDDAHFKSGKKLIAKAKQYLNSRSVDYIKGFASKKIKEILNECEATLSHSKVELKLLPCYALKYAALQCMKEKELPIIISLVRLNMKKVGESTQYTMNSRGVFFYEFQKGKNAFCYKEKLNESEKKQPAIVASCYSIIDSEYPDSDFASQFKDYINGTQLPLDKFLKDCDISNLLMLYAAGHIQLSKSAKFPSENEEGLVETLYRKHSDNLKKPECSLESKCNLEGNEIHGEYITHLDLAKKCNMVDARYSVFDGKQIKRRNKETVFAVDHICLSSCSRERERLDLGANATLDQTESLEIDKGELTLQALNKLSPGSKLDQIKTEECTKKGNFYVVAP